MKPIVKNSEYINENIRNFKEDWMIIEAPIGSGKTTTTSQLYEKKVLSIGARNSLGLQTIEKNPQVLKNHHLTGNQGYTKTKEALRPLDSLFINYSTTHKLSNALDHQTEFDYLLLDEPILTWGHSVNPDFINLQAENEFIYRLLNTPKVILMGGDMPEFLLAELHQFAALKNKSIQHVQYQYPKLEGVEFQFVSNGDEMNSEINEVLKLREKTRGSKLETKGVLMMTEQGKSIPNMEATYRQMYPNLNIIGVWSGNQDQYKNYLSIFSDPDTKSDIDMLITNQTWGMGIDIRNEFELIVQNYSRVPNPIKGGYELIQDKRDRDCKRVIIFPRKRYVKNKNDFVVDIENTNELYQLLLELGIKKDTFFERNRFTGEYAPRDIGLIKRYISYNHWLHEQIENRWDIYEEQIKKLGGSILKNYSKAITVNSPQYVKALLWDDPTYLSKAEAGLGKPIVSDKDKAEWDEGEYKDNLKRRKDLNNQGWVSNQEALKSQIMKLHKTVYETRKMFMQISSDEMFITNEQFTKSHIWLLIKKDKHKWSKLFRDYGWYFSVDDETTNAGIHFLEKVLRKYNWYTEVIAGSPRTRRDLKPLVKKKNLTAFNKWKKEQPKIQGKNITIDMYLWDRLDAGALTYKKLDITTQKYLKTYDHLLIQEYRLNEGLTLNDWESSVRKI